MRRVITSAQTRLRDTGATRAFMWLSLAAIGLAILLACLIIFLLPQLLVSVDDLASGESLAQRRNEMRTTGLQALAGLVITVGAVFTGFSVLSNREAQIDDRLTAALRLLGESPDPHIRRGAIYALERIVRQTRSERDAVVEILAAFIRSRSSCAGQDAPEPKHFIKFSGTRRLDPDVETALQAVVRTASLREGLTPDLRKTDWNHADLTGIDLSGVDLRQSQFVNAGLQDARLVGANLELSDLSGALLHDACLDRARMSECKLCGASLAMASAREASLPDMDATEASFTRTDFTNTVLGGTNFSGGASFLSTSMANADLGYADLAGATYNEHTAFPDGVDPAAMGARLVKEET